MTAKEYSLTVPVDLVKKTNGLAIDMGGSVVKIVHRSKENLEEAENGTIGHLQLVSFPNSKLTEALDYIKERAQITRSGNEEQPEIFATGIGFTKLGKTICESLNIRLNIITEFVCFVKAFTHLASQLSRKDFLEPHAMKAVKEAEAEMIAQLTTMAQIQEQSATDGFGGITIDINDFQSLTREGKCPSNDPLATSEDIYPCILAMCGSAMAYVQINADKSFKVIDVSSRGGRALLGVGALLTGNQTFEGFLELASRGDARNVDTYSDDLLIADLTDSNVMRNKNLYSVAGDKKLQALVYSFGKAAEPKKDDFRPEDLAIAWLNYAILDLVQCLTLIAQVHEVRRIFLCGSLCSSPLVRRILTTELIRRNSLVNVFNSKKNGGIQFDFIKPGPHLGALGALVIQLENLTGEATSSTPQP